MFETKWLTIDEVEEVYGKKKAEELRFIAENGNHLGRDSIEFHESTFGDNSVGDEFINSNVPSEGEYKNIKSLRIIERQHRRLCKVDEYVDPNTGDKRPVPENWSDAKAKKFAKKYNLSIISKIMRKVRWTVTCDHIVLHDDWSPYRSFTLVPFAYFRRGKPFGMVRNCRRRRNS